MNIKNIMEIEVPNRTPHDNLEEVIGKQLDPNTAVKKIGKRVPKGGGISELVVQIGELYFQVIYPTDESKNLELKNINIDDYREEWEFPSRAIIYLNGRNYKVKYYPMKVPYNQCEIIKRNPHYRDAG